jgi:hypothetical protein
MLTRTVLRNLAYARLRDAEILFAQKRYHAAYYLCGYSIEYILKARVCTKLGRRCEQWHPELRYGKQSSIKRRETAALIDASRLLLRVL